MVYLNDATLRKRKSRENEISDQYEKRHARDCENKIKKRASETAEQRKAHLTKENKRRCQSRALNNKRTLEAANGLNI